MILIDECEYRETKKRIGELKLGLASLEAAGPGGGVAEYEGKRSAYVRLIGDLERQAAEFEEARSGRLAEIRCEGFGELAGGLVRARLARGLSRDRLAGMLGWEVDRLRRHEEREYESATLAELTGVATVLCVSFSGALRLEEMEAIPTAEELLREVMRMTEAGD